MRAALLFAIMLLACDSGTDVVARLSDGGKITTSSGRPRPIDSTCEMPATLTVLTKLFEVHRFDLSSESPLEAGSLKACIGASPGPIAVDRSGTLWTASGDMLVISDSSASDCKAMPLKIAPTAMAFVWNPDRGREALYAIEDNVLYLLDVLEDGYSTTIVGKLMPPLDDVRGLAGTADGQLFAFAGQSIISISRVSVTDATVDPIWITKNPDGTRFAGGVPSKGGFELVFGPHAFAFDVASGDGPQLHMPLFPNDEGTLYVTAPPCWILDN